MYRLNHVQARGQIEEKNYEKLWSNFEILVNTEIFLYYIWPI